MEQAETIIEAEIFPIVLEHAGHPDELVRKAATSLIKEIVKHSPDLARLVVEGGGLGVGKTQTQNHAQIMRISKILNLLIGAG